MGDPAILFIFLLCQAVSPCYVWVSVFFIYPAWDVWYLIKWVLISFKNSEKFLAIVFLKYGTPSFLILEIQLKYFYSILYAS